MKKYKRAIPERNRHIEAHRSFTSGLPPECRALDKDHRGLGEGADESEEGAVDDGEKEAEYSGESLRGCWNK